MARGEQAKPKPQLATGELEQFKRLVELQGQLVELARRNAYTEKECENLWRELARAPRPARATATRLPRVLARLRRLGLAEYANRFGTLMRTGQIVSKSAIK